jgi:hypothetical protein
MPAASARLIGTGMSIEGMFAWKVPAFGAIAGFDPERSEPTAGFADIHKAGSLRSSGVKHYLPTLGRSMKETKTRSSCS